MEQNRFKSPVVWGAIFAQVISLGQITGLWAKIGVDAGLIGDVVAGMLQLGVVIGILNSSTDADKF